MRVALYGLGHMGRHHARHLAGHEVVVIDPPLGHCPSLDGVEAAVVAVPTALHAEVALPLLARGLPVLVEKPLAATLAEAEALAAWPNLVVGHVERFNPVLDGLRGTDLRFVQGERLAAWGAGRGTDVDVLLDLMVHDLDLFLHLCGGEVSEVRANGIAVATGRLDLAQARLETADGRVGTFTASRVSRQAARRWRAFAPGRYWSLDLGARAGIELTWDGEALREAPVSVPAEDALRRELDAFFAFARGEARAAVSGADGLRAVALALRIREQIG